MTEIKITRRIALDRPYEYYELQATYHPTEDEGNKVIKEIEKTVAFIMKLTAPKESKPSKKAAKISTEKIPEGYKEVEATQITDLKAGEKVNMSVRFLKLGEIKPFVRDGKVASYCKCYVEDVSGQIQMTLFDDQIALLKDVKENAMLVIKNGYVKEWQGKLELSVGKWGTLEVVYNG